ncbi:MAG: MerR family transcriptional regulator [Sphingobacteriaceae bacterium]|nr:MAG: MerR family transcriptional regulator [Sphingobacteriaceae bacterium]
MQYSISDLEKLSGISAHSIRIWERRYQALTPARTEGNTRYYDDGQLRRLLSLSGLCYAGHKISKVCALNEVEIKALLQQQIDHSCAPESRYEYFISQIISGGLAFREDTVKALIDNCIAQNGMLNTYKYVVYPLLSRLGLMWLNESICPSHEHFLSAIIRQKLFTAIDSCTLSGSPGAGWLLFLPEDEEHDIGLLLASYLLRAAGRQVTYLGPKVPISAVTTAAQATNPQHILFFITRVRPINDAQAYVNQLSARFPSAGLYVSGNRKTLSGIIYPQQFSWLESLADFEKTITQS